MGMVTWSKQREIVADATQNTLQGWGVGIVTLTLSVVEPSCDCTRNFNTVLACIQSNRSQLYLPNKEWLCATSALFSWVPPEIRLRTCLSMLEHCGACLTYITSFGLCIFLFRILCVILRKVVLILLYRLKTMTKILGN